METTPTLYVVDDDPAVSRAIGSAAQLLGLQVASFPSAQEFLDAYDATQSGCLVTDIKMPGMSGLELQKKLIENKIAIPIIMISGHADVRIAVEAMMRGAVTVLEKPFLLDELMSHLRPALERDAARRAVLVRQTEAKAQLNRLTEKELQVLDLIAAGKTNKQIAGTLRLSIRAIEDRRARLMKKLQVRSIAELIRLLPPEER